MATATNKTKTTKGNGQAESPRPKTVQIGKKDYEWISSRRDRARVDHPDWRITTELVSQDQGYVVMKAIILNDKGEVLGTGYAEENRDAGKINATSAMENCETSAVGRALSHCGYGGEGPSAEEMFLALNDPIDMLRRTVIAYAKENGRTEAKVNQLISVSELGDGVKYQNINEVNSIGPLANLLGKMAQKLAEKSHA
tara:strand:+ start:495 stop:1088 length:594 start_codon:yes stop_codon:yes gene_type:complete